MSINYFKIGAFTIIAFVLFTVAVVVLGVSSTFKKKLECVTYFNQSVQGLSVGSAVKFRGFSVGQVSDIGLSHIRGSSGKQLIEVRFYVEPKNLMYDDEGIIEAKNFLEFELETGLRTFIAFQGVTGISFLDLDYYDKALATDIRFADGINEDYLFIPPAPSKVLEISESIARIVSSVEAVDVIGIGENVKSILNKVDDIIGSIQDSEVSGIAITTLKEVQVGLESFSEFMVSLNHTVDEANLKELTGETISALKVLQKNLETTEQILGSQQSSFPLIMENLRISSENFKALSELARRHPSWILFGEAPKEVDPRAEVNRK